ncbi:MAG TPA: hypothetical protein VG675_15280 [Bryobacteraceae bacterium]|nr:hypothetical protein [Bryobacteraceae bacterium]
MQGVGAAGWAFAAANAQMGFAQAGGASANGSILSLNCNSGTPIPSRGRSLMKFSFNFPEPCVAFEGLQIGFRVFTFENVYAPDEKRITVEQRPNGLEIRCSQLVWAGGQQTAPGTITAHLVKNGDTIELRAEAQMEQRVKTLAVVVRGVPKGRISGGGGNFDDSRNNEVLLGYPFSAGDLNYAGGLTTPLVMIEQGPSQFFYLSAEDTHVRATRFYFQPCDDAYRVELITEGDGWVKSDRLESPVWRLGKAPSVEAAARPHFTRLEKTYSIPDWETRPDVPKWMRGVSLVAALHGMHYTGYVFNTFPKMLTMLEWMAGKIDPHRVLVFLPAWDGRYYWDYPDYRVSERLGGDTAFRRLIDRGHSLGFRFMPMYGTNAANRGLASYSKIADAATSKIDGDHMDLNWVDWDNDRHHEGWLSYMSLGVDSYRRWMFDRIDDMISRYHVDAYFLDIVGGWTNNPAADMHAGVRRLVQDLRAKHPEVMAAGEMHYDALLEFIPLFQVFATAGYPPGMQKYVRNFYHLSHPAPGRGSTGVHESGFGRWNPQTLSMGGRIVIPTLTVVDDTFDKYRDQMQAVVEAAAKWTPG